jgi:hypothetical protein
MPASTCFATAASRYFIPPFDAGFVLVQDCNKNTGVAAKMPGVVVPVVALSWRIERADTQPRKNDSAAKIAGIPIMEHAAQVSFVWADSNLVS